VLYNKYSSWVDLSKITVVIIIIICIGFNCVDSHDIRLVVCIVFYCMYSTFISMTDSISMYIDLWKAQ
jgi:hypothetical protein